MYCSLRFVFLLAVGLLIGPQTTFANPFETQLSNGLRIIVKEDHRAPVAVHFIWYRAGSIDEIDGYSGLAHVLEHLMFKGTKQIPDGEFSKQIAALGGRENAFTSYDYTAYFQIVPAAALSKVMAMEADRMSQLQLSEAKFLTEIQVVMEERRMRTEDNPEALVHEALYATAFFANPYHRPIIGWMNDLQNLRWTDAQDWYRNWYSPNNATLVIVGDVDHLAVFAAAKKLYAKIPARILPRRAPQIEPEQLGMRQVTIRAPAKLPLLSMAWKVPKLTNVQKDSDPYALEVLSGIFDGNDAARLQKNLVRKDLIAQSIGTDYQMMVRGASLFIISGKPTAQHTVAELEAAIRAQIKQIQEEGVSSAEVERVKIALVAAKIYQRDSLMSQAIEIGSMEAKNFSWRDIDPLLEKLRSITPEQVQEVARKYFIDQHLTKAYLDPLPLPAQAKEKGADAMNFHQSHLR